MLSEAPFSQFSLPLTSSFLLFFFFFSFSFSLFKIAKKILAPNFFLKKKIGDKNLAIFCSKNQGV